jgi:hypothetical protein
MWDTAGRKAAGVGTDGLAYLTWQEQNAARCPLDRRFDEMTGEAAADEA